MILIVLLRLSATANQCDESVDIEQEGRERGRLSQMAGVLHKLVVSTVVLAATAAMLAAASNAAWARNAFVANWDSSDVSVLDMSTNTVTSTIPLSSGPRRIALMPDGTRAYASKRNDDSVSVIDTTSNIEVGTIGVGRQPMGVAVSPDGNYVYAANSHSQSNSVSVIATSTNTVVATIAVGSGPEAVAVTPGGGYLYVSNSSSDNVSVVNTATNGVETVISVGGDPKQIAVTPDGSRIYVANSNPNDVSVIDTATNLVVTTVTVGTNPDGIAVAPDGNSVYVANSGNDTVSVIDTATNSVVATITGSFGGPTTIAIAPDGNRGYVVNAGLSQVTLFDTSTNTEAGTVDVGTSPRGVAIEPNRGPTIVDSGANLVEANQETTLQVVASDSDGSVTRYEWDFGDGQTATTSSPITTHTYTSAGTKTVTVTVTDNEGCSEAQVFTGQTVSCLGSSAATTTFQVTVQEPIDASPEGSPPSSGGPGGGGVPSTTILSGPAEHVRAISAVFTFASDQSSVGFECRLDSEPWGACASPEVVFGLALGQHTFQVRAQNGAGLTGPTAERSWSVDRRAPSLDRTNIKSGKRISRSNLKYISGIAADDGAGIRSVKVKLKIANRKSSRGNRYCLNLSFKTARRIVQRCKWGYTRAKGRKRWRIRVSAKMRRKLRRSDLYRLSIRTRDKVGNHKTYTAHFRVK